MTEKLAGGVERSCFGNRAGGSDSCTLKNHRTDQNHKDGIEILWAEAALSSVFGLLGGIAGVRIQLKIIVRGRREIALM